MVDTDIQSAMKARSRQLPPHPRDTCLLVSGHKAGVRAPHVRLFLPGRPVRCTDVFLTVRVLSCRNVHTQDNTTSVVFKLEGTSAKCAIDVASSLLSSLVTMKSAVKERLAIDAEAGVCPTNDAIVTVGAVAVSRSFLSRLSLWCREACTIFCEP